jgi:hypothetical protein
VGYSMVHVDELPGEGPGQEEVNVVCGSIRRRHASQSPGPEGMTMIAVGARRGSYEPRGPF